MVLVSFVEFSYLRACGSFSVKKKMEDNSGVSLAKGDEVDDVCAPFLGGVINVTSRIFTKLIAS